MIRKIIGHLPVWDVALKSSVTLNPGTLVSAYQIVPNSPGDAYLVNFSADDRQYHCPLFRFQPRTSVIEAAR